MTAKQNKTAEFFRSVPWYGYVVGAAVLIFVGKKVVKAISEDVKRRRDLRVYEGSRVQGSVSSVNLAQIAGEIHDAFYNNDWFGWTEDEDRAITALSQVPKQYVPDLAKIYSQMYQENLYNDFVSYLSSEDYLRVRDLLT